MLNQMTLAQFTGDMERFRHGLCRNLLYTPGIQYLCEQGGAYWLLDAIASYQHSSLINHNEDLSYLQFWVLKVDLEATSAVLELTDGNSEEPFISQQIPFTDFPLAEVQVWVGDNGNGTRTAYLPSEH